LIIYVTQFVIYRCMVLQSLIILILNILRSLKKLSSLENLSTKISMLDRKKRRYGFLDCQVM
jgi:hypothetical protein